MATFETNKALGDIERPELLPGDWYICRIMKEPVLKPNNKEKQGLSEAEGAGNNLNLFVRVQSENPKWNGRPFFLSLPWPTEHDEGEVDGFSGMTVADVKLERLANWSAAFSGKKVESLAKAKKIKFSAGDEALLYIDDTEFDWRDGHEEELINSIDIFRMIPRVIE